MEGATVTLAGIAPYKLCNVKAINLIKLIGGKDKEVVKITLSAEFDP